MSPSSSRRSPPGISLQIVASQRLHRGLQRGDRFDQPELADQIAGYHPDEDSDRRDDHQQPRGRLVFFVGPLGEGVTRSFNCSSTARIFLRSPSATLRLVIAEARKRLSC
jgi:hypothetical protein